MQARWVVDVKLPTAVVGPAAAKNYKTSDIILSNGGLSGDIYNIERTQRLDEKHSFSLAGKGGDRDHYPRPRLPQNKDDLGRLPPVELLAGSVTTDSLIYRYGV